MQTRCCCRNHLPVVPPTFTPRDEAAWELVQEYLERIDRGDILFEGVEQFLSLGREILSALQHTIIRTIGSRF